MYHTIGTAKLLVFLSLFPFSIPFLFTVGWIPLNEKCFKVGAGFRFDFPAKFEIRILRFFFNMGTFCSISGSKPTSVRLESEFEPSSAELSEFFIDRPLWPFATADKLTADATAEFTAEGASINYVVSMR